MKDMEVRLLKAALEVLALEVVELRHHERPLTYVGWAVDKSVEELSKTELGWQEYMDMAIKYAEKSVTDRVEVDISNVALKLREGRL